LPRLFLGFHEDVAGVDFLLAGELLGGVVVDLVQGLVGGRSLGLLLHHDFHQGLVAQERHALLESGGVGDLLELGGAGDQDRVSQIGDEALALVSARGSAGSRRLPPRRSRDRLP